MDAAASEIRSHITDRLTEGNPHCYKLAQPNDSRAWVLFGTMERLERHSLRIARLSGTKMLALEDSV